MGIKLLSRETIEQITAGEVVERPVSVVKELVENSIDSGADGISVEIRGGGIDYIRVSDNGCGINASEVKLAFQNHATSKISEISDLDNVLTMGFRGEALPSIAAVSKVALISKPKSAETGIKLVNEGGTIKEITPIGCPDGTSVTVSELFYNIPVRKTFLRKPAYEQTLISELLQKLAIGNPSIAFKYILNGKIAFQTYGDDNPINAAQAIYGSEYSRDLKQVNQSEGALSIKGYIGVGEQAFTTRARQCFFLNGRLINCRTLSQALEEVCRGRVTIGKYPSCVLNITMPTAGVDVNVHPTKLEVRFKDEAALRLSVEVLLSRALNSDKMGDALSPKPESPTIEKTVTNTLNYNRGSAPKPVSSAYESLRQMDIYVPEAQVKQGVKEANAFTSWIKDYAPAPPPKPVTIEPPTQFIKESPSAYRLIGVYADTYIIIEAGESLVLIDQHAAHERLNYEKYTKALDEGVASQPLLVPVIVELSPRELQLIEDNIEELKAAGYEAEPFGDNSLRISAVPFIYGSSDLRMLFKEMTDELALLRRAEKERRLDSIIQASCKHAVKGGDKLTDAEIRKLMDLMAQSDSPPTCPHGRPIMKVFTKRMVEQMFKRIQ